jgi:hypothetical protein
LRQRGLLLSAEEHHVGDGNPRRGEGSSSVLVLDAVRQGRFAGNFRNLMAQNRAPTACARSLTAPTKWRDCSLSAAQSQLSRGKLEVLPVAPPSGAATGYCFGPGAF